jgi:plastocyanin
MQAKCAAIALMGLALLLLVACQEEAPKPPPRKVTPLDLSTAGTISGQVLFAGPVPEQTILRLGGWAECASQHAGRVYAGDVLVHDGKLQNAVVYVQEGLGDRVFAVPEEPVIIDQKGCVFLPRTVGLQAYQPLRFLNSDPMAHNVHGLAKNSGQWNFSLGVKGSSRTIAVDKAETMIQIKCDVHPWMRAYIGVFDHPYFALSGTDGSFTLKDLPPGEYVIEAWHERFGTRSQQVFLGAKESKEIVFTFAQAP